jgi:hypothetical protein
LSVFKFDIKPVDFVQVIASGLLDEKYLQLYQGALIPSHQLKESRSNNFLIGDDYPYYGTLMKSTIEEAILKS